MSNHIGRAWYSGTTDVAAEEFARRTVNVVRVVRFAPDVVVGRKALVEYDGPSAASIRDAGFVPSGMFKGPEDY